MKKRRPKHELVVPPAALRDEEAVEMMRVWIVERGLHCSLNIGFWSRDAGIEEDQAWGMVFADAIRHVANALHEDSGVAHDETIRRLFKALELELGSPTSNHRGGFVNEGRDT